MDGLTQESRNLLDKLKQHLKNEEEEKIDIDTLETRYKKASDALSEILSNNGTVKVSNIPDAPTLEQLLKELKAIKFPHPIPSYVRETYESINKSKSWFTFLKNFETETSKPKRLRNLPNGFDRTLELSKLLKLLSLGTLETNKFEITPTRRQMLDQVLNSTLISKPNSICYGSNRQRVTGLYMKLSEALAMPGCSPETKWLEIFVGKKLWIDDDIDGVGKNFTLVVVSPIWEVVGERWLQLDGEEGSEHLSVNPETKKINGSNGLPGLPGGNGGHFFGTAHEVINLESLRVTANGGDGSPGQHGGVGVTGQAGVGGYVGGDVVETRSHIYGDDIYTPGRRGGEGGYGGRGGVGGFGGYAGTITINFGNSQYFRTSAKDGVDGSDGNEGFGGYRAHDTPAVTEYAHIFGSSSTEVHNQPHICHNVERRKHQFSYLNHSKRQLPPTKFIPNFHHVAEEYGEYMKGVRVDYPYVTIPKTLDYLPRINGTRENSAMDYPYFFYSMNILDLILRKCTKVRALRFYENSDTQRVSLETSVLATRFEELLKELKEVGAITGNCEDFDPIPMIEELKKFMIENRYDGIRRTMIKRIKEFGLNPEFSLKHFELVVDQLLNN